MSHPYQEFIHKLERPGRYVGGEYLSIVKPQAETRIALAFPDVYEIGMSHMGFKILYDLLNRCPDIASERVFAPWEDLERELRSRNLPLVSLETGKALKEFDLVGFSLQYEMTYTNILLMLDLGGIPLRSADRGPQDPLIIAGGPCAMSPEPTSPFIDLYVIGDGEEAAVEVCRAWTLWKREGVSRTEALRRFSTWKGIYIPSFYLTAMDELNEVEVVTGPIESASKFPIERRIVEDLRKFPFPTESPVPFTDVVFNRFSVELARGCTEGCRFCQAGMIYRPVREREPKEVIETISKGLEAGGYDEASLTALSTADYSAVSPLIKDVLKELRPRKVGLGVSSLRAYGLSEDVLDEMSQERATGLTFAPEAGTQRMRDVISKNISEEEMLTTAQRVFSRGWKKIKLYFMIGLPTETEEDVRGIAEISRKVRQTGVDAARRSVDVTVSISSHVPKPHTPFQWAGMNPLSEIESKQRMLAGLTRKYRLNFRTHPVFVSHIEGIVSRGDRRVAAVIESAYRKGCRFDGWDEKLNVQAWEEALAENGVNGDHYLRPLRVDGRLPWDHIDVGVTQKFLATEYRRAVQGRLSPPCGKPAAAKIHHTNLEDHEKDERLLVCYHCGIACDLSAMRTERADFLKDLNAITPPIRELPSLSHKKRDLKPAELPAAAASYRLCYSKRFPAAWISHLDLIKMFDRVFRRSGVRVAESGGYHPKPKMSFGPALPLGMEAHGELLDITLLGTWDPDELLERLNQTADPGLRFLTAERLTPSHTKLSKAITAADYWIALPSSAAVQEMKRKWMLNLEADIEVVRNDRPKRFLVRDHILSLEEASAEEGALQLAENPEAIIGCRFQLRILPEGSLRPREVLLFLLGTQAENRPVSRLRLIQACGEPAMNALSQLGEIRAVQALAHDSNPSNLLQ